MEGLSIDINEPGILVLDAFILGLTSDKFKRRALRATLPRVYGQRGCFVKIVTGRVCY